MRGEPAYLPHRLQVQVFGFKPALGLDESGALDGHIHPLVCTVCIVKKRELHVVVAHVDLSEGHRAPVLAPPRLQVLLELPALVVVPVAEKDVSSDVVQELNRGCSNALGAACRIAFVSCLHGLHRRRAQFLELLPVSTTTLPRKLLVEASETLISAMIATTISPSQQVSTLQKQEAGPVYDVPQ